MNRGIEKEVLTESKIKGKNTKANPIRVDVLMPEKMEADIVKISEAMMIEKAATMRMLIWFAMRFAPPFELSKIASEKNFKTEGQSTNHLDIRITQAMLNEIENLMKADKQSKSKVVKVLLYWALANIGSYTIDDWLTK